MEGLGIGLVPPKNGHDPDSPHHDDPTHHHHHHHHHHHVTHHHAHGHVSHVHDDPHDPAHISHTHERLAHPGFFRDREAVVRRDDAATRAFTVGIGGPVGSGKTALTLQLCRSLRDRFSLAVVTNDIFTTEDGDFLVFHQALPAERIVAIETGSCPHAAIRDDVSRNLLALEDLTARFHPDFMLLESGGDNLSANFSRELADYIIYVIDVAGGDKVPRKGGPGVTQSDLLVINKTDLAPHVGADLAVMRRDAELIRQDGPICFTQARNNVGVDAVVDLVVAALTAFRRGHASA